MSSTSSSTSSIGDGANNPMSCAHSLCDILTSLNKGEGGGAEGVVILDDVDGSRGMMSLPGTVCVEHKKVMLATIQLNTRLNSDQCVDVPILEGASNLVGYRVVVKEDPRNVQSNRGGVDARMVLKKSKVDVGVSPSFLLEVIGGDSHSYL
ncbi:hypothetical protein GH714_016704 [Hevea brasiliensis]|uniref:Uncharacterized protein n=1 Tax=Hevea brasiliensis TaxID=3981 RepID=A0A6A6L1M1_HEVBR|nr:hypothetical protein GH714_016704 [Hevea brasiliensis]